MATDIRKSTPTVLISTVVLDLSSQSSIRDAAKEILSIVDRIDLLINNAGVMTPELTHTKEGIEMQFGTNYIGHFLLTNLLMSEISVAAKGSSSGSTRIINVTSQGHRLSPVRFHDYNFEGKPMPDEEQPPSGLPEFFLPKNGQIYSGFLAYGQCKTANILFSIALTERLEKQGIHSYAVHPGCRYLFVLFFVVILMLCSNTYRSLAKSFARRRSYDREDGRPLD